MKAAVADRKGTFCEEMETEVDPGCAGYADLRP